jgi:hypothetical protein
MAEAEAEAAPAAAAGGGGIGDILATAERDFLVRNSGEQVSHSLRPAHSSSICLEVPILFTTPGPRGRCADSPYLAMLLAPIASSLVVVWL